MASTDDFDQICNNKKIICFAASKHFQTVVEKLGYPKWLKNIIFFVDNAAHSMSQFLVNGYPEKWKVYPPDYIKKFDSDKFIILITAGRPATLTEIVKQLMQMDLSDSILCYCLIQMENTMKIYDNSILEQYPLGQTPQIKKAIHCFWFSGEEKPKIYRDCIESWKRNCPDYNIIEWDTTNYDIGKSDYMKQAFEKKKWAFISDYARLDVIYHYGGIYLDMDVEVIKNLDELLKYKCFLSIDNDGLIDFGSGFGAVERFPLIGELLSAYDEFEFVCPEGDLDFNVTIPQPILLLPLLERKGYQKRCDSQIVEGAICLSPDYIRVIDDPSRSYRKFKGTEYAIHWHNAGWFGQEKVDNRTKYFDSLRDFLKKYKELCSIHTVNGI